MIVKSKTLFIFLLMCILPGFGQEATAIKVENKHPFSSDKPLREPTIFAPGLISTGDYEFAPEFTHDGKTLYFVKSTPDFTYWTMVYSQFEEGKWSQPRVAPFSGQYTDGDPFITADGKQMFFISNRPLNPSDAAAPVKLDIWVMNKTASGWSEPKNLGKPVNEASQYFPTIAKDGTLYFGSTRKGGRGGVDLYRSKFVNGAFQEPENLGDAINTPSDEYEPFIAPDESFLIFMANARPDGLGGYDLFVSYNENGQWTKAQNLGSPINSAADDYSPKISRDGKYFFWTSTRSAINKLKNKSWDYSELTSRYRKPQNGLGDIYYIDKSVLKIKH